MVITINVTQEDIDHGVQKDCKKCPVARAIKRTFQYLSQNLVVSVDYGCCYLDYPSFSGKFRINFGLPVAVDIFISAFDMGNPYKSVEPFSFQVNIPNLPIL